LILAPILRGNPSADPPGTGLRKLAIHNLQPVVIRDFCAGRTTARNLTAMPTSHCQSKRLFPVAIDQALDPT
jgi:hypothetical protein